ncbi:uncharacterized protein [Hyperolius riggenbachi]|uniref:uncharacterized protein n=1 Tax=Hyperolius riggenbachi TaxID=752182 RepID=UPI0035A2C331
MGKRKGEHQNSSSKSKSKSKSRSNRKESDLKDNQDAREGGSTDYHAKSRGKSQSTKSVVTVVDTKSHPSSQTHKSSSSVSSEDYDPYFNPNMAKPAFPAKESCWICGRLALPNKKVCDLCHLDIAREDREVSTLIKQVVKDTVSELNTKQSPPRSEAHSFSTEKYSSDDDSEHESIGFDFSLIPPFVARIKEAIQWEDDVSSPKKKRYYKQLDKVKISFPLLDEIKELITDEWEKTVKKPSLKNKLQKLYPLAEPDEALISTNPLVDASLMKIVKNVTLPLEDSVSFSDLMDRQIDQDLKRAFLASGEVTRIGISLTSVAKALKVWIEDVQKAVVSNSSVEDITFALEELSLVSDFVGTAAVDTVRSSSRSMLYNIMARRALWLKPWSADPTSKQSWAKIPFDGKNLFGSKMDTAISRVTGGKSGLIPQDRKFRRTKYPQFKRQQFNRFTEARSYRPGKEFKRNWKSQPFQRSIKSRVSQQTGEAKKSF